VAKVTTKLQVTVPKALAERYGIAPGAEIDWQPADDAIRMVPRRARRAGDDRRWRLKLFDQATERQHERENARPMRAAKRRGWTRDDLYSSRGRAR
jgi:bifunctional DNA-binding transcriptional regulator/antitoxin component of YhaV-PrlF toxin-antitoxin module